MADISQDLQKILDAIYGEEVRGSIYHAIGLINDVSEVILTTGTAINAPTDSSEGYFTDSLYLNTNTYELWKCVGTNAWQSLGILKGATGNGIDNITKTSTSGLVDTYTITYTDGTSDTFDITNGEDGENGNKWYRGMAVSGKAVLPTVYPTGIANANTNDFYLNPSEGAIYHCVTGGDDTTATWSYDFTMTGGGGGGSIVTWTQIQSSGTKIAEIDIDGSTQDVFAPTGGGGTLSWGNITGTLSNQSDLQSALDGKADSADVTAIEQVIPSGASTSNKLATASDIPTVNDGQLTIQQNGTNKATFTANQSGNATANIITDTWTETKQVQSDNTVTFTGLNDNYGYDLYCENKLIGYSAMSKTGSGTSVQIVYTVTGAANGDVCKLRILK